MGGCREKQTTHYISNDINESVHPLTFTSSVQLKLCLLHTRVVQKGFNKGTDLWPSEVNC